MGFVPSQKNGLRLLFHANAPWVKTGYGVQSNSLLPRLAKLPAFAEGGEIALLAYYGIQGGVSEQEIGLDVPVDRIKVECYPARSDPWGNDVIADHTVAFNADLVITLFDLWPLAAEFGWTGARWCLPYDEMVQTDIGLLPIGKIVEERLPVKVLADHDGRSVWAAIEAYQTIPAKLAGTVMAIRTEGDKSLRVTAENLVMTRDGWVPAREIKPGMEVQVVQEVEGCREGVHCGLPGCGRVHCSELQAVESYEDRAGSDVLQQRPDSDGLVGSASWSESDRVRATGRGRPESGKVASGYTAVLDREESAGSSGAAIHGISGGQQRADLQCTVHRGAAPDVSEDARAEFGFERCSSVEVCERQPATVYDIKTSAGCFVAGGILAHNCPWFPVDHEPIPPGVLERARSTYENLVYSKSAAKELQDNSVQHTYIPHGVETTLYKPLSEEERKDAKEWLGFPRDCFLVGTVGANKGYPPRKGWNEMYTAMAEFLRSSPDPGNVFFYQHSLMTGEHGGPDLSQVAEDFGLSDKIRFANPYKLLSDGMTNEQMNRIYNAMDVFILLSRGEGFGLPILEAQSCGTPVIVTDWTACRELGEVGYKIPILHREWTPQRSFWGIADPQKAAAALQDVQAAWLAGKQGWGTTYANLRTAARNFALPYDWQKLVDENWAPFINRIWEETKPRIWGPMKKVWEDPTFGVPDVDEIQHVEELPVEDNISDIRADSRNGAGDLPELVPPLNG